MTGVFADAPSPVSSADALQDQNWTFDTPSTFFIQKSRINKQLRNPLPGEHSTQTSPPPSEATGSPDYFPNPSTGIMAGQSIDPTAWSGGISAGGVGYSVSPPPGMSTNTQHSRIMSPTSSGGSAPEMGGSNRGLGPQVADSAGVEADMMVVDIDWVGESRSEAALLSKLFHLQVHLFEQFSSFSSSFLFGDFLFLCPRRHPSNSSKHFTVLIFPLALSISLSLPLFPCSKSPLCSPSNSKALLTSLIHRANSTRSSHQKPTPAF